MQKFSYLISYRGAQDGETLIIPEIFIQPGIPFLSMVFLNKKALKLVLKNPLSYNTIFLRISDISIGVKKKNIY